MVGGSWRMVSAHRSALSYRPQLLVARESIWLWAWELHTLVKHANQILAPNLLPPQPGEHLPYGIQARALGIRGPVPVRKRRRRVSVHGGREQGPAEIRACLVGGNSKVELGLVGDIFGRGRGGKEGKVGPAHTGTGTLEAVGSKGGINRCWD